MTGLKPVKVALDWTPNTLHTGFYVALDKGLYRDAGLDVTLSPPDAAYSTTPARLVESGAADLCICPSESCLAYAENGKMPLQAIYAICQSDASAIVAVDKAIETPRDLAERVYGSYNARYEDDIVRAMITHAGGDGEKLKIETSKGKLTLFDDVLSNTIDATWVFLPWEGVEAEMTGHNLVTFRPGDYGVPYGYSPVVARKVGSGVSDQVLKAFVQATRRGYEEVLKDALGSIDVLRPHCSPAKVDEFLLDSQERINKHFGHIGVLGKMDAARWDLWIHWLSERGLTTLSSSKGLWTNDYLA